MNVNRATAFVTGGAQGIGLGIARALANAGARVALADVNEEELADAERELSELTDVATFSLDVRDRDHYAEVAGEVERQLGPVSILCNNAGVGGGDDAIHMSYESWDWMLGVNIGGVVNGIQTFLPRMIDRGEGHIVNTASGAGLAVDPAWQVGFMYPTTKYAVVGLSEALRIDLEPRRIGVSVLCPGPVATRILTNSALSRSADQSERSQLPKALLDADEGLLQRGTDPDAVGALVVSGIEANSAFILTDQIVAEPLRARVVSIENAMALVDAESSPDT